MQKRFIMSAGVVVILLLGKGLGTAADDKTIPGPADIKREFQKVEHSLEEMSRFDDPNVREIKPILRTHRMKLRNEQLKQILRMLGNDEITNQQLRNSVVLLAAETLALRERVAKLQQTTANLDRKTSWRIVPAK